MINNIGTWIKQTICLPSYKEFKWQQIKHTPENAHCGNQAVWFWRPVIGQSWAAVGHAPQVPPSGYRYPPPWSGHFSATRSWGDSSPLSKWSPHSIGVQKFRTIQHYCISYEYISLPLCLMSTPRSFQFYSLKQCWPM